MGNDRKWIYLSYAIIIALVAWVLHKAIFLGLTIARLPNPKLLQVAPASAVAAIVIASIAGLIYFKKPHVELFSLEVLQELKKVTWPLRDTATKATMVVVVVVGFVAAVLLGMDSIINWVIGLLLQA